MRPGEVKGLCEGCVAGCWHCFSLTQVFWTLIQVPFLFCWVLRPGQRERKDGRGKAVGLTCGLFFGLMVWSHWSCYLEAWLLLLFFAFVLVSWETYLTLWHCFPLEEKKLNCLSCIILCIWIVFIFFFFWWGNYPFNVLFYKLRFLEIFILQSSDNL